MLKLAIDVDGVVANFVDSMLPHMNHLFGSEFKREDIICFEFWKAFRLPKSEFSKFWVYMEEHDLWRSIAPMPKALEKLKLLDSSNVDFEYVTARPKKLEKITLEWLFERYEFPSKEIIFEQNKQVLVKGYNFFIDDKLEDCLAFAEMADVEHIFLFNAPWNQCVNLPEKILRVDGWKSIEPSMFT